MFLSKRVFSAIFGGGRLLEVAALTVAGAIAGCYLLNDQAPSSIYDGAGLRGGYGNCTTRTYEYDCGDCMQNFKCTAQPSYGCDSYTGSLCFQCDTIGGGQCVGLQLEYMANPNFPPCFIQYLIDIPQCERSWEDADDTSCDGACA
jgi:hypothetical protein